MTDTDAREVLDPRLILGVVIADTLSVNAEVAAVLADKCMVALKAARYSIERDWRDISEAPKETPLWLWTGAGAIIGEWGYYYDKGNNEHLGWWGHRIPGNPAISPTHFKPAPKVPET